MAGDRYLVKFCSCDLTHRAAWERTFARSELGGVPHVVYAALQSLKLLPP